MKRSLTFLQSLLVLLCVAPASYGQDPVGYQTPPASISSLLLAQPTPFVFSDSKGERLLIGERSPYPTVEELGQPELKIAGLRLNPNNFAPTRQTFINNIRVKNIKTNTESAITGLPASMLAGNIDWSPGETRFAFLNSTAGSVDLYVVDLASLTATKWNKLPVNSSLRNAFVWADENTILYKAAIQPASDAPKKSITPVGPAMQQSLGKSAPNPTFQDLIKSPYDEQLFEFYCSAQLIENTNGNEKKIGQPSILIAYSISPDKKYILNKVIRKPYSYLVTAGGFPSTMVITDRSGASVKMLAELPSSEVRPSGNDNTQNVQHNFSWRDDESSTVVWCVPLDSGLIKKNVPYHDAVYGLKAPFTNPPKELFKTTMRYYSTIWGDSTLAIVVEGLNGKQSLKYSFYNTQRNTIETMYERNQTDAYHDLGSPVTFKNRFGRDVIQKVDKGAAILMNNTQGSGPKGDQPYLSKFVIATKKNDILWRCPDGVLEFVTDVIDPVKLTFLTRKETPKTPPNFYFHDLKAKSSKQITDFPNPYPQLANVSIQKIFYKRADSVNLTGTLYLPAGYNKEKDGPLPTLIWAYPREFNSAADAAQIRGSQFGWNVLSWASPVYYVTQGYAVLDNAEMPIVSKGNDTKPNDNFIEQLHLNAEAAINKLVAMGVGDRDRMAVGGHSYGAFMTANLLAHTNLFKAGIARSGAYNRTLTPFGFQNEDRTYWQAPQLYYEMSPFSYADKIKTPLLLIHGEADDNTGTYPINSERLFNAIKGNGGTTRLVFLPYEAHSYRGKENLLHMHWEQFQWLEKYVKSAPAVMKGKIDNKK